MHGDASNGLAAVSWHDHRAAVHEEKALRNLFLFVDADPETGWLAGCTVAVDAHGFVRTGSAVGASPEGRLPAPLESSIPGVLPWAMFGEGAAAVAQIHQYLAD